MSGTTRHRWLLGGLALASVGMFGFGYALRPLYYTLCRLTGFNQLEVADTAAASIRPVVSRTVVMQFDSNLRDNLPWTFRPEEASVELHPGQIVRTFYDVSNNSDRSIRGQAIASYAPESAAPYVRKLECFCFTTQTLAAHEHRRMAVTFVVDPALPSDVAALALSYTFFEVAGASSVEALAAPATVPSVPTRARNK